MNRAVALRIAACGLMGLGAALLIAALLLSTYTKGKISKVPLDIDTTLVSDGTGTAFDPASLLGERFVVDRDFDRMPIGRPLPRFADAVLGAPAS